MITNNGNMTPYEADSLTVQKKMVERAPNVPKASTKQSTRTTITGVFQQKQQQEIYDGQGVKQSNRFASNVPVQWVSFPKQYFPSFPQE
jgi:hypothetical protein